MSIHGNMLKLAKQDQEFLTEMAKGKDNSLPSWFASDIEICVWATCYYGYLVGKYGIERAEQMKQQAKDM